jgi:hypothetical protein
MARHIEIPDDAEDPAEALAAVLALRRLADGLERAAVGRAEGAGWLGGPVGGGGGGWRGGLGASPAAAPVPVP